MKKIISVILCITLVLTYGGVFASAEGEVLSGSCGKNASFTLKDGVLTVSGTGEMNGYYSDEAPWYGMNFDTVIVEDGITSVGYNAFRKSSVKKVVLADSVDVIGVQAFDDCVYLKEIKMPAIMSTINYCAFDGCESLESIAIPEGITIPPYGMLRGCEKLTSVTFPSTLTSLSDSMFSLCVSLKNISLPGSLTLISDYAFFGCCSLEEIIIPEKVTSIGNYCFYYCTSLSSLNIPASVKYIGTGIVAGCDSIKTITVDENNETFDSRENCNAIIYTKDNSLDIGIGTTVIPDSVTNILQYAFAYCKSLTALNIPASVTKLGDSFVCNCPNLDSIIIDEANPAFTSAGSNVIIEKSTNTLYLGSNNAVIPDGVVKINSNAFVGFNKLEALHIPASVTDISFGYYGSFRENSSLKSITVDENNTKYDSRGGCNAIISTSTDTLRLGCCNTIIPDGIVTISNWAFGFCADLKSIAIPDSVTTINADAFDSCTSLESIVIPDSVKSIGSNAFYNCKSLSSVKLSSKIEKIAYCAFEHCTSLTEIVIPDSVTAIDEYAFNGCSSLETITLPASLTEIGYAAFEGCEALKTVYYKGTDENKEAITTAGANECLTSAEWIHLHTASDILMLVKPSCSKDGYEYCFCTVCGEKVVVRQIEKLGHTPETIPGVAPTCTGNGSTAGEKCSVCGEILTATTVIPATGHDYKATVTAPTCKAKGCTTYTCTACGDTYTGEETEIIAHSWDGGKVTKEATTEEEGEKTFTCTVCGETKTEIIAKLEKTEPEFSIGDVDGDGNITVSDARLALRASIGLKNEGLDFTSKTNREFLAADADKDGEVKVQDARLILRAAIGLENLKNR